MYIGKRLMAAALLASFTGLAVVPPAQADPLTPLNPHELVYVEQVRQVLTVSHDNLAFRSDGELLDRGRYACRLRELGMVGTRVTWVTPAITQLAFIHLCPN